MTEFSRREFLRRTGGVVATLLLPMPLAQAAASTRRRPGVRVIVTNGPLSDATQHLAPDGVWMLTKTERMGRRWVPLWVPLAGGFVVTDHMIVEALEIRDGLTPLVRTDFDEPIRMAPGDRIQ